MKNKTIENIVKNIVLVVILAATYPSIKDFLINTDLATDKPLAGDLLVAVSILAVTACFGNFAFTYEKICNNCKIEMIKAHITTGLLMLVIGLSLEMTSVLSYIIIGSYFSILNIALTLLYFASMMYDFWDFKRHQ